MRTQSPRKKRIMLVDDDVEMLPIYELAAEIEDTLITIKRGGISALRFLYELNYDVDAIILDLSMPDMDGITLTRQIRQNEKLRSRRWEICIFWYTGWPYRPHEKHDPVRIAELELNVSKVYTKPADPIQIIREVKEVLEKQAEDACETKPNAEPSE